MAKTDMSDRLPGLICMNCHSRTDDNPDLSGLSMNERVDVLFNWLCAQCVADFDEVDADSAALSQGGGA